MSTAFFDVGECIADQGKNILALICHLALSNQLYHFLFL
jgi:hypothetical protein